MTEYIDNTEEFKARLRADLNTPDSEVLNMVVDAIAVYINKGHLELDPLRQRYPDLVCPWCGRFHFKRECQDKIAKMGKNQDQVSIPEGFDPYSIFYDVGSVGLTARLQELTYSQLEAIRIKFTTAAQEEDAALLIEQIVKNVKDRCNQSVSFGDYKLPD